MGISRTRRGNVGVALIGIGAVAGGLMVPSAGLRAQSGQRQLMFLDDGSGPMVLHASMPDFHRLRTPDYLRTDLPIFAETLRLDEFQRLLVGVLLDTYLSEFKRLAVETLPAMPSGVAGAFHRAHEGAHDEAGPGLTAGEGGRDSIIREAFGKADEISSLDIDIEGPTMIAVMIEASAGDGSDDVAAGDEAFEVVTDGEVAGGGAEASVFISVGGAQDLALPEELRKKLEEKALELAEKIRERISESEAAGLDWLAGDISPADRIEERRRHFREIYEKAKAFVRTKARLREEFVTQVLAQLSGEQLERWPSLDRTLTRHKKLPQGRLDGERTNLLKVVEKLGLDEFEQEAISQQLYDYEVSLHNALVARDAYLNDAGEAVDKALESGDPDKALSVVDRGTAFRVAVRTVNEQFTDTIAARLSAPNDARLPQLVRRASYPRVYRRTRAQKAFDAAGSLGGLDEETRTGIDELQEAYAEGLEVINERLRRTIHKHQPLQSRRPIEHTKEIMSGKAAVFNPGDDPIRSAFRKRSKYDERFMKQLYAMFTLEQVATLPKLPSQTRREPIIVRRWAVPD